MWDLIVSVPDHWISFYFSKVTKSSCTFERGYMAWSGIPMTKGR